VNRSIPLGEVRELGDRALLIGVADAAHGRALAGVLADRLASLAVEGRGQMVGGFAALMVGFDSPDLMGDDLVALVRQAVGGAAGRPVAASRLEREARTVVVPCAFDGPDLEEVARIAGCTPEDVVRLMTAEALTVGVVGFSPGFAYLTGLPAPLHHVPRRARPRAAVRPGSVALANGQAAVYPTASPGGWQLVGRTGETMFTPWQAPYARLAPGDRVQFVPAAPGEVEEPTPPPAPSWSAPGSAHAVFEVVQPGIRTVLQDAGRPGVAAIGVPGAGPADPVSWALANRLVGNDEGAAALEIVARGPVLRCLGSCHVAVVGGASEFEVDGQKAATGQVLPVSPGQVLEVGTLGRGFRTYLSVAGGLVGLTVFGSVASDQLCGLGPGSVTAGQRIYAAPWSPPLGDHLVADTADMANVANVAGVCAGTGRGGPVVLRVVPGPHAQWFAPDVMESLDAARFVVEGESNRVGLRLRTTRPGWKVPMAQGPAAEIDSQGVVTGAVQVPPGGDPIVLMPDHATLGGYPVVAVVVSVDHGVLGQCAPGAVVQLVPIEQEEARQLWVRQQRAMARAVVGHYPLAASD
jgi:KipI family sensor histidine kinase inhibitor